MAKMRGIWQIYSFYYFYNAFKMFKKASIFICLFVFCFQAFFFNAFLYGVILSAKIDEGGYTKQLSISKNQYKKLNWLSRSEFSFGNYFFDIKEIKRSGDKITLLIKTDLKEKNFLEKLVED